MTQQENKKGILAWKMHATLNFFNKDEKKIGMVERIAGIQ